MGLLVLDRDGAPLAVAAIAWDGAPDGDCLLHGLYVDPAQTGKGIGRTLLRAAADRAREAGRRVMSVRPHRTARSFYLAQGFVDRPTVDAFADGAKMLLLPLGASETAAEAA